MKWFSRIFTTAFALILVLALVGCGGGGAKAEGEAADGTEPIKIGAVLSLTGNYAALGVAEKNTLEMEVDRINKAGGIDGSQIELIIKDDATDEAKAVAAATELIDQDQVVAILGASGTGQSMAIRQLVDQAGIPQISMAGGTVITSKFDKNVFQTPWSNTIVVPFVLEKIKADGHAKIAVISSADGYGKDGLPIIEAEAKKAGLTIVANKTFNPGDTDFTAQLTPAKSSAADAILIWTAGKEGAALVKSAGELGLEQPMYGGSGQAKMEFVTGSGEAGEGFVFGTGKSLVPANWGEGSEEYTTVADFADRYKAAYGVDADIFAGHAFDAMNIIVDALKRAGADATGTELRDAVEQTDGLVGFGGIYSFSATDHNGLTTEDLALYEVKAGAWEPIK